MGSGFSADGKVEYRTPIHGLPLPPPPPGHVEPEFNGNGQYRLPDPETGKMTSYTRASIVAKTLEDTYMLDAWTRRMLIIGLTRSGNLAADLDQMIYEFTEGKPMPGGDIARGLRVPLNNLVDDLSHAAGAKLAAEFGTATHAWCEWIDNQHGHITGVPEMFRPWAYGHRAALADAGLSVEPGWTERVVLNTRYGIAGTLDRLFRDSRGILLLGDIKTSRGLDFSWLYFAIQLAIYHGAQFVLSRDGKSWEPMPELDPEVALISHLPRENPEQSVIVPINMEFGAQALHAAMAVRRMRTRAEKSAQNVSYGVGSLSAMEMRHYQARLAVEYSRTQEDLAHVWAQYEDVWTDELTEFGWRNLQLATATESERS